MLILLKTPKFSMSATAQTYGAAEKSLFLHAPKFVRGIWTQALAHITKDPIKEFIIQTDGFSMAWGKAPILEETPKRYISINGIQVLDLIAGEHETPNVISHSYKVEVAKTVVWTKIVITDSQKTISAAKADAIAFAKQNGLGFEIEQEQFSVRSIVKTTPDILPPMV